MAGKTVQKPEQPPEQPALSAAPTTPQITGVIDVGMDMGYGVFKAVALGLPDVVFPSVVGHKRQIKFRADEIAKKYPGDQISDDDGDWFVGQLALSQIPAGSLLRLRGRAADNDALGNVFRVRLAKVGLGKLFAGRVASNEVIHVRIATGLPVNHMGNAATLKETLRGQHRIVTDSADFVVNVVDVMVMPQPYGTIYDQMLTVEGDANPCHTATRTGVVDIGNYTIDLTLDRDGEYIDVQSGTAESGVSTAHDAISDYLEKTYGQKPEYGDVEKALKTGCYWVRGKSEDVKAEVDGALEPLRSATLNLMQEKWQAGVTVDVIYLSGGGAELVYEVVSAAYPQTQLVKNPQLANARGYLNYAIAKSKHAA